GLPTTPFLIAASYCFVRSSPRLHRWLRRSPVFGRLLHDWEVHRGIRKPVKVFAVCLVVVVVGASIVFGGLPAWAKVVIGCLAAVGVVVILSVPTVRDRPSGCPPRVTSSMALASAPWPTPGPPAASAPSRGLHPSPGRASPGPRSPGSRSRPLFSGP